MQANELRIGNLLYNNNVLVTIDARSIFDIWDDKGLKEYKPIPLTEEWLLKFGFSKRAVLSSVLYDMKNPRFSIYLNPPIDKSNKWNILGIEKNINIQYVHQLQNLYFALTGEELTIKQQEQ
jgi:hypothetical protein